MMWILALYAVWMAALCAAEWLQRQRSGRKRKDADGR